MTAIYKRELKSYFHSVIGHLFIAATLFFIGLYFTVYNLFNGYPYISYAVSSVVFLFLISVPILTMRILAEEKKQKTDQLILTAPVGIGQIVMGKFLALLTIFAIPTAVTCVFPLILTRFGTVPLGESYVAILGFFLYGAACIAIGIFISSLTESTVIAAVLTFAVLFITYVMSGLCNLISQSGNWLTKILGSLDLVTRFDSMLNGTLDISAVVYFISIIAVMLFLTTQSIQKRRYSVSVKSLQFGAYSSGLIVMGIAVTVFINLVVGNLPDSVKKIDVTSEKLYSLTDQTKDFMAALQEDVTVYVLANENSMDSLIVQTLDRYESLSKHLNLEYVDPAVSPKFYTQYTDSSVSSGSLIVVSDKRSKVIDYNSLYETSIDYTTYTTNITGYDAEGQLTSALAYVTSENMPKVYNITGHGELEWETYYKTVIEKENVEYEDMTLLNYEQIPEDAECIIINAPTNDFSKDDADKVLAYLKNGGKAIVTATWTEKSMTNFESILDWYGISIAEGIVVEKSTSNYTQYPVLLVPEVEYDSLTNGIYGTYNIFMQMGRGLYTNENADDSVEISTLLSTSDLAFSKVDITATTYEKEEGDIDGPFALGMKAVKTEGENKSTLIVFGSEGLFTESSDMMVAGANLKLFTNCLSSLVEHETTVAIAVKSYELSYLSVTEAQKIFLGMLTTIVIPIVILVSGIVVWVKRRKA